MNISKIGAKVVCVKYSIIQSKRLGNHFFLTCNFNFEKENLLTKYSFSYIVNVHSKKYGHMIFDA